METVIADSIRLSQLRATFAEIHKSDRIMVYSGSNTDLRSRLITSDAIARESLLTGLSIEIDRLTEKLKDKCKE